MISTVDFSQLISIFIELTMITSIFLIFLSVVA